MDGMKREDAVLARLEAEIAAIEEEIRRTERYLRMNAGRPAEDLVVGVKKRLYDLCRGCEEKRRELRKLLEPNVIQITITYK